MKDDIRKEDDEFDTHTEDQFIDEEELEDVEENEAQKIKKLKEQLRTSEKEKMEHLENLQRAKADFLNGKRRIEEEKIRDRERSVITHVEKLIPLCDSFHMAKSDTKAWDAIDPTWKRGIESIENQLQSILSSYGVVEFHPEIGSEFDPAHHEAMANIPVTEKNLHHTIMQVIQNGFLRKVGGSEELIRPARVTVGEYGDN
jgi:molecular chaperone GrpE